MYTSLYKTCITSKQSIDNATFGHVSIFGGKRSCRDEETKRRDEVTQRRDETPRQSDATKRCTHRKPGTRRDEEIENIRRDEVRHATTN